MTRRPGFTMTEVLTALFIMALGTIAILTLFPLGMLNMGQALKDDRTGQSAATADGYMRWYWKQYVVENQSDPGLSGASNAFDNPGGLPAPTVGEPSYPVFVDPIGYNIRSGTGQNWVGSTSGPPRRNLYAPPPTTLMGTVQAQRTCTLLDGLTYETTGLPYVDSTSTKIERDMRYTWLWVLQRPPHAGPGTVKMTVVVFDKRGTFPTPEDVHTQLSPPPPVVPITLSPGTRNLQLPASSGVVKGTWILDATRTDAATGQNLRHANFYRVISSTENPSNATLIDVELDTPIKRSIGTGNYSATIIVLAGVSEVFARPDLTP